MGSSSSQVLAAIALLSCAPAPPAPVERARPVERTSVAPATSSPAPAGIEPPPMVAEPPAEPSPFIAQAELERGILGLHPAGRRLLVTQDFSLVSEPPGVALWHDGALDLAPEYREKLPTAGRIERVIGDFPDVRAFTSHLGASSMYAYLHRYSGRGWVREARLVEHHLFRSVANRGKRTLVLTGPAVLLYPGKVELLELWAGGGLTAGPALARGSSPCPASVVPHHVVLSEDERLFVFGRRCRPDGDGTGFGEDAPMVEWYARRKRRGTLVELPVPDGNVNGYEHPVILSESPEGIELAFSGTARRLFFDGASFALRNAQGPKLWELTRTSDGTQWGVTTDNTVVSRKPGGDWRHVPLPQKPASSCRERDCSMKIAALGDELYLSIESTLYQLHGPPRSPVPKHRFPLSHDAP